MFPIYVRNPGTSERIYIKEFAQNFKKICSEHQEEGKASSFALIIHDFKNPQVTKVLKDDGYFNSLNEISGHNLTVFYLELTSEYKQKSKNNFVKEMNRFLFDEFEVEDKVKTPAILFFQVKDKEIIDYFFCSLKENTVEKSYLELEGLLVKVSSIMEQISPENRKNYEQIFNLIKQEIDSANTISVIKSKAGKIYKFGKIILFIEKIYSLI
jgi:hypothetical protein